MLKINRYYPCVDGLLSLDIEFKLEKASVKEAELNLYYKLGLFSLNYMQNPKRALLYLEHVSDTIYDKDLIATKSFMGQVCLAKGLRLGLTSRLGILNDCFSHCF